MAELPLSRLQSGELDSPTKGEAEIRATHVEQANVDGANNGFAKHEEADLTLEEKQEERRFLWKADLVILPLLACMYFLASMVCIFFVLSRPSSDFESRITLVISSHGYMLLWFSLNSISSFSPGLIDNHKY
jgi:hypothetical protein